MTGQCPGQKGWMSQGDKQSQGWDYSALYTPYYICRELEDRNLPILCVEIEFTGESFHQSKPRLENWFCYKMDPCIITCMFTIIFLSYLQHGYEVKPLREGWDGSLQTHRFLIPFLWLVPQWCFLKTGFQAQKIFRLLYGLIYVQSGVHSWLVQCCAFICSSVSSTAKNLTGMLFFIGCLKMMECDGNSGVSYGNFPMRIMWTQRLYQFI